MLNKTIDRLCVLIAEDYAPLRQLYAEKLTQLGATVTAVGTGAGALSAVTTARFDAVLLDVRLGDVHARTLLSTLRTAGHAGVIVCVTGALCPAETAQLLALGAGAVVSKSESIPHMYHQMQTLVTQANNTPEPCTLAAFAHALHAPAQVLRLVTETPFEYLKKDQWALVQQQSDALQQGLERTLAYAKKPHTTEPKTRVSLSGFVAGVVAVQCTHAPTVTLDPVPDVTVHIEEHTVRCALRELVHNAQKYTPVDGTITLSARTTPRDTVQLTVTNTGVGIAPAARPHLFVPFVRGHHGGHGFGVGLAAARSGLRRCGHELLCDSDGTSFVSMTIILKHCIDTDSLI